jgi:hypothetical protein
MNKTSGDNTHFTTRFKTRLIEDLKHQTLHLKEVTRGDLTANRVNIMDEVIVDFEEQNKFIRHRDERGKSHGI